MFPLQDRRWNNLLGGYRIPYDPALQRLQAGDHSVWSELRQGRALARCGQRCWSRARTLRRAHGHATPDGGVPESQSATARHAGAAADCDCAPRDLHSRTTRLTGRSDDRAARRIVPLVEQTFGPMPLAQRLLGSKMAIIGATVKSPHKNGAETERRASATPGAAAPELSA